MKLSERLIGRGVLLEPDYKLIRGVGQTYIDWILKIKKDLWLDEKLYEDDIDYIRKQIYITALGVLNDFDAYELAGEIFNDLYSNE